MLFFKTQVCEITSSRNRPITARQKKDVFFFSNFIGEIKKVEIFSERFFFDELIGIFYILKNIFEWRITER